MSKRQYLVVAAGLVAGVIAVWWLVALFQGEADADLSMAAPSADAAIIIDEPIQPLLVPQGLDAAKVALGDKLFHEVRLSADDTISCSHCHDLARGGMDGMRHSLGIHGGESDVNAPTVFNAGGYIAQFWDGRADTLESQVDGPINHARELGSSWPQVVAKLKAAPDYDAAFRDIYPAGVTVANIKDAITSFERSLVTVNSPFDRYLRGDENAISTRAKAGYQAFKEYGCAACHQGANVGGNLFQVFGVMGDYFADRGKVTQADLGRFNVTGQEKDKHVFRVPSLRLVVLTAPYFHDGSAKTLPEAIHVMAKYQLGREMLHEDELLIIEFLHTLVGEYKGKSLLP